MRCSSCQAPITKDTRFCAGCGQALPWKRSLGAGKHAAVLADEGEMDTLTQLNNEKQRLTGELRALLEISAERDPTEAEAERYSSLRARWKEVGSEVTKRMSFSAARQDHDRRTAEGRQVTRRIQHAAFQQMDRRSGDDRRSDGRRIERDRRDPFPEETL